MGGRALPCCSSDTFTILPCMSNQTALHAMIRLVGEHVHATTCSMHAIFRYTDYAHPETENPGKWNRKIRPYVEFLSAILKIRHFGFLKNPPFWITRKPAVFCHKGHFN